MWTRSGPVVDYAEENAMSYNLLGLPPHITSSLHLASPGHWYFKVQIEAVKHESPHCFQKKEAALDGLKDWLRTNSANLS